MPSDNPQAEAVDAFVLFNEREETVLSVVSLLESAGLRTYLWRRDIPVGAEWQQVEFGHLLTAKVVLVFLGSMGWGSTHESMVDEALRLGKAIILVVVSQPPEGAFTRGRGIFERSRYIELTSLEDKATIRRLVDQIRSAPTPVDHQFDALVSSFVDGPEEGRLRSLQRIKSLSAHQRIQLAFRLRAELTSRFSLERVSDFASSVRDPMLIPSIRSWLFSALIWCDAESEPSQALIRRELQTLERATTRFWLLAGLYQVKALYLTIAAKEVASTDVADEAVLLARVVAASPSHEELMADLRSRLESGNFERAWPALRVMRVVPLPELVPAACRLFLTSSTESAPAYDALYALCGAASEAAELLTVDPGVEASLARIVEIARLSNEVAKMNFTVLLAAFRPDEVERALSAIERDTGNAQIARTLRSHLRDYRQRAGAGLRAVAGFVSDDINPKNDFLGFERDVQILTSVMMAKAVTPPLAIGLFGDWGTGKSHFMESMREAIKVLRDRADASDSKAFCRHVVQIRFNAWHYVDTNLWASLVSHILERLAAYVNPSKGPDEQRQELLKELPSAKDLLQRAGAEQKRVSEEVKGREAQLKELRAEREQKEVRLRDLRFNDLRSLLEEDPEAKAAIEDSLTRMGVPVLLDSMSDLSAALKNVQETRPRFVAMLSAIVHAKCKTVTFVLLVLALAGIPTAVWLLTSYLNMDAAYMQVSAWVGAAVASIGAMLPMLKSAVSLMESNINAVNVAKARVDALMAAKRDVMTKEEAELQGDIAALSEKEEQAASRLAAASVRVAEIEERIKAINEENSLTRFLSDRTHTDDYRKHLGLTSIIRRDFEDLRDRLFRPRTDGKIEVERVILYIDDLDRCAPAKVMEVLQAVHLLLAYDLFVVVVGVDPRWLLHALHEEYTVFAKDEQGTSPAENSWQTTPQNYLEKIFQIPYCLPRMTPEGFAKMVTYELASTTHGGAMDETVRLAAPEGPATRLVPSNTARSGAHPSGQPVPNPTESPSEPGSPRATDTTEPFEVVPEALAVRPWETRFAERLEALIPTPRAVKRFANIYRMLKASVLPARLLEYEGTEQFPGDFQVPMTLLAMLIGSSAECTGLFPRLFRIAQAGQSVVMFLNQDPKNVATVYSKAMQNKLQPIISDPAFPISSEIFVHWLPQVARFSFDVGKSLLIGDADGDVSMGSPYVNNGGIMPREETAGRSEFSP
jgi:hypothetical protein